MSTGSSFDPQQALSKHVLNNFYVGGTWVEPQSDRKLELISPMTEECFVKVPEASNADVDRAVRAAREAFDKGRWPRMSPQERAKFVTAMGEELKKRLPLLTDVWTAQVGALLCRLRHQLWTTAIRVLWPARRQGRLCRDARGDGREGDGGA